jgi:succinate dehydrogenase/fumarate reductase flavoprotein subunit
MPETDVLEDLIEADVLVVGAGFAGLWAAIRARESVDRVVLVEKGTAGKSGCSTLASGVQL